MAYIDKRWLAAMVVALLIAFGLGSLYGAYAERQKAANEFSLTSDEYGLRTGKPWNGRPK